MRVIVGLGNPGEKYQNTRHNAGFMVVDQLASNKEALWSEVGRFKAMMAKVNEDILVKPLTFMNKSGEAVSKIMNFYKLTDKSLIVIHDDLDIRLGEYKVQSGKGPKDHKGIKSIEKELGYESFVRYRIGVDNREAETRIPGEEYVLMKMGQEDRGVLDEVVEQVVDELNK